MSRALFICAVVLDGTGAAYPAILDFHTTFGFFPCVWTITKFNDVRRVAVGLAEVTAAQFSAIDADARIRAVDLPSNFEELTWGDLQNTRQTAILNFLTNRGVDTSGITNTASLVDVISLLCERFRAGRKFHHLQAELHGT